MREPASCWAAWGLSLAAILELIEQRRRLVELHQVITAERAMVLLAAVVDVVRRHVSDPAALVAIAGEVRALATGNGAESGV